MSKLNHHSILLSDEENQLILSCLAVGETSLSTTVVQLVLTTPPDHNQWQMFGTGVMCFVKNNRKRTYFFRLYDFDQKLNVWEQEIYLDIKYVIAEPMFHMFEAETCMAGISFIEPTEANYFCDVVQQKAILLKRMLVRSESKVEVSQDIARENQDRSDHLQVPDISPIRSLSLDALSSKKRFSFKVKSRKKSKTKISKLDIGLPTNFKHVQHIGWSPSTGFDFNVIDPMLDNFFKLAGISDQHLSDVDTRKFIFDFIDSHGGIETAIKEAKQPTDDHQLSKQVESSVDKTGKSSKLTKEPTLARITRSSSPLLPPPPPPPIMGADSNGSCAPPPPPPPPPPSLIPPNNINTVDSKDQLSESLLNSDKKNNSENSCGRDQLLQQIRGGISLKKIERSQESTDRSGENKANPLASALSEALQNRFRVNQSVDLSSDESDDNKDNDEVYFNEWSE